MKKQNFRAQKKEKEVTFVVKENSSLLDFLSKKMGGMSKTSIKGLLQRGQVFVNDQIIKKGETLLSEGCRIKINFSQNSCTLRHSKLSIIYEDDAIILVNKGAGLISVAT